MEGEGVVSWEGSGGRGEDMNGGFRRGERRGCDGVRVLRGGWWGCK